MIFTIHFGVPLFSEPPLCLIFCQFRSKGSSHVSTMPLSGLPLTLRGWEPKTFLHVMVCDGYFAGGLNFRVKIVNLLYWAILYLLVF